MREQTAHPVDVDVSPVAGLSIDPDFEMVGKRGRPSAKAKGKAPAKRSATIVYQEMLREALPLQPEAPERPLKRPRTGRRDRTSADQPDAQQAAENTDDEDDLEFVDVLDNADGGEFEDSPKRQQTACKDSDGDSDGSDYPYEGIDFDIREDEEEPGRDLELTLVKKPIATPQCKAAAKRRAVTKAEKITRIEVHKMHVLCLLSFLSRRNHWCNDEQVQKLLKPLLDKKILLFLRPRSDLPQFGQTESLKRGLTQASSIWKTKFNINARGLKRALWADDESQIQNVGGYNLQG